MTTTYRQGGDKMSELVSAKAMAELWGVPVNKVTRWCKEGKIPGAEQDRPGSP